MKLQATFRKDRHTKRREVEVSGDLLASPPPRHLTADEREIWKEVCKVGLGQLWKHADQFVLEAFVAAVAAHRAARAALAKESLLIEPTRTDTMVHVHPLTGEIRRQAGVIRDTGEALDLTPQSRLRLLDGRDDEDMQTEFGPFRVISGGHKT